MLEFKAFTYNVNDDKTILSLYGLDEKDRDYLIAELCCDPEMTEDDIKDLADDALNDLEYIQGDYFTEEVKDETVEAENSSTAEVVNTIQEAQNKLFKIGHGVDTATAYQLVSESISLLNKALDYAKNNCSSKEAGVE